MAAVPGARPPPLPSLSGAAVTSWCRSRRQAPLPSFPRAAAPLRVARPRRQGDPGRSTAPTDPSAGFAPRGRSGDYFFRRKRKLRLRSEKTHAPRSQSGGGAAGGHAGGEWPPLKGATPLLKGPRPSIHPPPRPLPAVPAGALSGRGAPRGASLRPPGHPTVSPSCPYGCPQVLGTKQAFWGKKGQVPTQLGPARCPTRSGTPQEMEAAGGTGHPLCCQRCGLGTKIDTWGQK